MKNSITILLLTCCLFSVSASYAALTPDNTHTTAVKAKSGQADETVAMLASLLDLQKSLQEQINVSRKKLKNSTSEAEKAMLEEEISSLDKQLSGTSSDFERLATGVEPALFAEKRPETFSWKEELSSLLEPAIKELKRLTVRARQKTRLKDNIVELKLLGTTANAAVNHLQNLLQESSDKQVQEEISALLPEWQNIDKRLQNKLELAERELAQLKAQDVSLVEMSSNSVKIFFRDRGMYLIVAVITFVVILLCCRLLYRFIRYIFDKLQRKDEQRSFQARLFDIVFQVLSFTLAVIGLFFILYLAEDWFLLSIAIIFFLGLAWTVRQTLPRLWQQGRLMLNIGSIREEERIILHGVPWKVVSINVFCKLVNPVLEIELRIPIEDLVGMVSRPFKRDEPWFPCKKGDWVVVGTSSRARVVSLSHEQVEVVERGGKRIVYPTDTFLQACPINLSRNFRIRVPFGISYSLQQQATTAIPLTVKEYLETKMETEGYSQSCLNLQVEFFQANSSSLDIIVLADFHGDVAEICKRLERALQRWCVDCCTAHGWEIPFPQLTVHRPAQEVSSQLAQKVTTK